MIEGNSELAVSLIAPGYMYMRLAIALFGHSHLQPPLLILLGMNTIKIIKVQTAELELMKSGPR